MKASEPKEYWINVYYHSVDKRCYQGNEKYKSRSEAICWHLMLRNGFYPRPVLAYFIHVKLKYPTLGEITKRASKMLRSNLYD